jgi:hypothetical protein
MKELFCFSTGSSVSIVSDYGLDDRAIGVRSPAGQRNFPLTSVSRPALGPTQPPVQWVPGILSLRKIAAGAWHWPLTPIYSRGQEWVGAIPSLPPSSTVACSGTALLLLSLGRPVLLLTLKFIYWTLLNQYSSQFLVSCSIYVFFLLFETTVQCSEKHVTASFRIGPNTRFFRMNGDMMFSLSAKAELSAVKYSSKQEPQASSSRRGLRPMTANKALVHWSQSVRHRAEGCMALRWW